jgi:hypothetical protein
MTRAAAEEAVRAAHLADPGSITRPDELVSRGAGVSEVFHDAGGVFHHAGTEGRVSGPAPNHQSYGSFASFSDPDGNGWLLQEITTRLSGR